MKLQRFAAILLMASFVAIGCGDDEATPEPVVRLDPQPQPPGNNPDPNNNDPTTPAESLLFRAVSDLQQNVDGGAEVELRVELIGSRTQAGKANETIRYTILQAPNTSVTLSAQSAVTNAEGQAFVTLSVGHVAGPIVVRAAYPGLAPVEFEVRVAGVPGGSIQVEIRHPNQGPATLAPYRVRAYPATLFSCANFPRRIDTQGYAQGVVSQGLLTTLTDVSSEQTYTVTVQAMGNGNLPIATGCVNTVAVQPEQTTNVIVQLELMPLDPTGTYDVRGYWDLTQAIAQSGGAGGFLIGLIDFMSNPGAFIYDFLEDALSDALGFDLEPYLVILGVPNLVENTVNNFVFQNATLAEFRDIAQGLQGMLNNLEVESELVIDKTQDDFTFTGYEHWQKVILYFTWQCNAQSPPGCGRYEIPVAPNGTIAGLGHVSYDWTGNVSNYNQLNLYSIETRFAYGALMVTILEQVVIPQLTGGQANTVSGFLNHLVNCPGIAQSVAGAGGSLAYNLVNGACGVAVAALANYVTAPLLNLQVDFDLELDGTATLVDGQAAGFVDTITNGLNLGTVTNTGAPVTVQWSAELTSP